SSPFAPLSAVVSYPMVLPLTTTRLPCREGPPHGLIASGARQTCLPVSASRQKRARSPTFSLSRNADATKTCLPSTATGASTCHFSFPSCQTRSGLGLGSESSEGGTASSSFFFSSSYFASSAFHFA